MPVGVPGDFSSVGSSVPGGGPSSCSTHQYPRQQHLHSVAETTCSRWWFSLPLSDGKRVAVPVRKDMTLARNSAHTYHFEWKTDFLNFSLDQKCIAAGPLTLEQNLDRWVRPAAMCIAPPSSSARDFQVTNLPFRYSADFGHPTLAYCHAESVACCQDCEHWFCEQHGLAGTDVCLSCLPETFLEAGASTPPCRQTCRRSSYPTK